MFFVCFVLDLVSCVHSITIYKKRYDKRSVHGKFDKLNWLIGIYIVASSSVLGIEIKFQMHTIDRENFASYNVYGGQRTEIKINMHVLYDIINNSSR